MELKKLIHYIELRGANGNAKRAYGNSPSLCRCDSRKISGKRDKILDENKQKKYYKTWPQIYSDEIWY